MSRLGSTIRKDMIVQSRNNIYSMTLVIAVMFAIVFSLLLKPEHLGLIVPAALLFVVGGTTIIFVALLIMEEKELGILNALTVSPLNTYEYLISKISSITLLATLEVAIMIGIPIVLAYYRVGLDLPNIAALLIGVLIINCIYCMIGVIVSVRFNKFTDFMFPGVIVVIFLQIPTLYFAKMIQSNILLIIPSSAPVMFVYGAFNKLDLWQWVYATGYSLLILGLLGLWTHQAYIKHVKSKLS